MNNQSITSNMSYSNTQTGKLRVGVMKDAYPYAFCRQKKVPAKTIHETEDKYITEIGGIAVKIWETVSKINNFDYEFICIENSYNDAIKEVENGKYDVVLGDFSITIDRLNQVLFSRSYYIGELRIFRKKQNKFIYNLFTNRFLILLIIFFIFIILFYTYVYVHYKHTTYDSSFFYIYSSFFQNNLYLFYPNSSNNFIRFINFSWSFIRFFFFAVIITQMINIIIQTSNTQITKSELDNVKDILVLADSSYVDMVKTLGKNPIEVNSVDEIIKKIHDSNGDVYWFHESKRAKEAAGNMNIEMTENLLFNDEITIIVNKKYPDIVQKFNDVLVEMQDSGDVLNICKIYLEDRLDACLI